MNYCDFLFKNEISRDSDVVLVDLDTKLEFSYEKLKKSVLSLSSSLSDLGVKNGDVVLLHLFNSAEVVLAQLAVQYLGGISCLLDPLIPVKSLKYYLEDSNTKHLITHIDLDKIKLLNAELNNTIHSSEILPLTKNYDLNINYTPYEFDKGQLSLIYYTSGTTNKPKGVMLSPDNYFNHVKIFSKCCYQYKREDKLLCFVPFSHGYGSISIFLPCLEAGSSMYIMRSFHPQKVVDTIEQYNITHIFGVPSHFQQLLKRKELVNSLKKLKAAFTAAAILKPEYAEEWKNKMGFFLDEGYGLIETSTGVAFRINRLPKKMGDIGTYPMDLVSIEIFDENLNKLKSMEKGEIVIKSESVMLGYLNKAKETKDAIVDGWFRTGDMGYKNHRNEITLIGRIKDVINIAGIKVSPFEIEAEINTNESIQESAVFGIEDETYGEIVVACIRRKDNSEISEREIIKYLQKRLINFQIPKKVIFKNKLPRNNMGKIDKKLLKDELIK